MHDFDDVVPGVGRDAFVVEHLAQRHHHLVDDFPVLDGDVSLQIPPVGSQAEATRQVAQHLRVEDAGSHGNLVVGGGQRLADGNETDVAENQQRASLRLIFDE